MSDSAALKSSTVLAPSPGAADGSGDTAEAADGSVAAMKAASARARSGFLVRLGAHGSTIGRALRRLSSGCHLFSFARDLSLPRVWIELAPATPERDQISVGHDHREIGLVEDVAGRAAENHLPQPTLGVGALDDQVGAGKLRFAQDGVAGSPDRGADLAPLDRQAMALQVAGEFGGAGPRHCLALHGHDRDVL